MFYVPSRSPPTPQFPSMMNHSGSCRSQFDETYVHVGGSGLGKGVLGGGMWEVEASGAAGRRMCVNEFSLSVS